MYTRRLIKIYAAPYVYIYSPSKKMLLVIGIHIHMLHSYTRTTKDSCLSNVTGSTGVPVIRT